MILTIPDAPPSWNKFYAGKHWIVRKKMADRWHLLVAVARFDDGTPGTVARFGWCPPRWPGRVQIIITVNHPDARRRDPDNICAKLVIDGLVQAGILPDDSDTEVSSVTTRITRDRSRPRETVVTITQEAP